MASVEPLDLAYRLKFEAAIQDHVAKKATSKRAKAAARARAEDLRQQAKAHEDTPAWLRTDEAGIDTFTASGA